MFVDPVSKTAFPLFATQEERLGRFKEIRPHLDRVCEPAAAIVLPEEIDTEIERGCFDKLRAGWDKTLFTVVPKLSTPAIVLGLFMAFLGTAGVVTAISGWNIPGFELFQKYMPISLVFSLTLIKSGLHTIIRSGVKYSNSSNRNRQEAKQYYKIFKIMDKLCKFTPAKRDERIKEVLRLNARHAPELRLDKVLKEGAVFGKQVSDIDTSTVAYRNFLRNNPGLVPSDEPGNIENIEIGAIGDIPATLGPQSCWDKWYQFWNNSMPFLGAVDMALGVAMGLTSIAGIIFLCGPSLAPAPFDIITKDPFLSISFSAVLLTNAFGCLRVGWRAIRYNEGEYKRAKLEYDLDQIDNFLELTFLNRLHAHYAHLGNAELNRLYRTTRDKLEKNQSIKAPTKPTDSCVGLKNFGKKVLPYLSTPTIILSLLVTLFGLACLGMSTTGTVPEFFSFLTKNTPLSALFSLGLVAAGMDGMYRGTALRERNPKDVTKKASSDTRESLIAAFLEAPTLPLVDTGVEIEHRDPTTLKDVAFPTSCWYHFWIASLKKMALPNVCLGSFLLLCGLIGFGMCLGLPVADSMKFIVEDPSYSAVFCLSLIALGASTIDSSWRMLKYQSRKAEDKFLANFIEWLHSRLYPDAYKNNLIRV